MPVTQTPAFPTTDEIVRTLVEVVPTPVVVADFAGCYVYVNPAASEFFGRPADALIGRKCAVSSTMVVGTW